MNYIDLFLTLPFIVAIAGSPGPATLTIAGTAMGSGRRAALLLSCGILTASITWSVSTALGLAALLAWQSWIIVAIQIGGALYLSYLGYRCLKSALRSQGGAMPLFKKMHGKRAYITGFLLHISNPKAALFFPSFYALMFSFGATKQDLPIIILFLLSSSTVVFIGYAWLFSSAPIAKAYQKSERSFNFVIGIIFFAGAASLMLADL